MAINKDRIVRIINSRAVPANQPLPPSMPGYVKDLQRLRLRPRQGEGAARRCRLRRRLRDRALRLQHRPQPAHRPGDPAGPRGDRHQGGRSSRSPRPTSSPPAAPEDRADDLVGRHGLDRRLPRSVQLLRADPRLRRRRPGRLELVVVLQRGPRADGRRGRRDDRPGQGGASARSMWSDLHQDHGGCAVGADLQRAALHHALQADGRRRLALRRSGAHPGQLRRRVATDASKPRPAPSTRRIITSGGIIRSRPSRPSRRGRSSSSSARTPPAASFRRRARSPTCRASTSAGSTRSPARSSSTAPSRATRSR